jgi:hypothetical protein
MENALMTRRGRKGEQDEGSADNLHQLIQWLEDAEEATDEARQKAERDRDYYNSVQLTMEELVELRARGQPDVVMNHIQAKIDYLKGFEASTRVDPRAFPRTPQDEEGAEAATDGLRYVEDVAELDQHFSQVWENMLIEGYGGVELTIEQGPIDPNTGQPGQAKIGAVAWDWDRLGYDPHSRKPDFSDARYKYGVLWLDADEAKAKWPEAQEAVELTAAGADTDGSVDMSGTYEDRPRHKQWVSGKSRKRVRIVQMYYRDSQDQWQYCVFTKGGKLKEFPVPFRDQDGKSWCPLFLQSSYVDRENNRFGVVRSMIGPQDEINKRRSKALHLLNVRQTMAERGAVDDVDQMKIEMAKADGHVEINPGYKFELLGNAQELAGHVQLMQEAKSEIELRGPNAALLGQGPDAASGRAINANKQSGQTQIASIQDRHRYLKKRVFMGVWDLIRQYMTQEWWVRVTDNEENAKFVGFNRPVTRRDDFVKQLKEQGADPQQIQQQVQEIEAEHPGLLDQTIRIENQPHQMHMDITIEEVPDVANIAEEQFQALTAMAPAVVFPPEIYLEASSLRNKKELIEKLKNGGEQTPQQQQMAQQQQELQMAGIMGELEKLKAEIRKLNADATKTEADAKKSVAETRKAEAEAVKHMVEADVADAQLGQVTMPLINGLSPGGPPAQP